MRDDRSLWYGGRRLDARCRDESRGLQTDDDSLISAAGLDLLDAAWSSQVLLGDACRPGRAIIGEDFGDSVRAHLAIGTLPIAALRGLDVNTDPDLRVASHAADMWTVSDAGHAERPVGPYEPQRCHVRKALGVERRQVSRDIPRENLLDLVEVQAAWGLEH